MPKPAADAAGPHSTQAGRASVKVAAYTLSEFTKAVTSGSLEAVSYALGRFNEAAQHDTGPEARLVALYAESATDCAELFGAWEAAGANQQKVNGPVLEALGHVVTAQARQALGSRALATVRRVLRLHMRPVYSALASAGARGALSFLLAAASLGASAVQDLLLNFNFGYAPLSKLAGQRSTSQSPDAHTLYVRFVLALLSTGDAALTSKVLGLHAFSSAIIRHLPKDTYEMVQLVLGTLQRAVVDAPGVSKTARIQFFASPVLLQLAQLYSSDQAGREGATVRDLAHVFLLRLCGHTGTGLCYGDGGWGAVLGGRAPNPVLLRFAQGLPGALDDPLARQLLQAMLAACPDTLGPYWGALPFNLEARLSLRWLAAMALLLRAASLPLPPGPVPDPPGGWSGPHAADYVTALCGLALPGSWPASLVRQALQHAVPLVRSTALGLLGVLLDRCGRMVDRLGPDHPALPRLKELWRGRLPDVQLVIALHQAVQAAPASSTPEALLRHVAILRVVRGYQQAMGELLVEARLDYGRLLPDSLQGCALPVLAQLLHIMAHADNYRWAFVRGSRALSPFGMLLGLWAAGGLGALGAVLEGVLTRMVGSLDVFSSHGTEAGVWLGCLQGAGQAAVELLDGAVGLVASDPYTWMDRWAMQVGPGHASAQSAPQQDGGMQLVAWDDTTSRPLSPLVLAALHVYGKRWAGQPGMAPWGYLARVLHGLLPRPGAAGALGMLLDGLPADGPLVAWGLGRAVTVLLGRDLHTQETLGGAGQALQLLRCLQSDAPRAAGLLVGCPPEWVRRQLVTVADWLGPPGRTALAGALAQYVLLQDPSAPLAAWLQGPRTLQRALARLPPEAWVDALGTNSGLVAAASQTTEAMALEALAAACQAVLAHMALHGGPKAGCLAGLQLLHHLLGCLADQLQGQGGAMVAPVLDSPLMRQLFREAVGAEGSGDGGAVHVWAVHCVCLALHCLPPTHRGLGQPCVEEAVAGLQRRLTHYCSSPDSPWPACTGLALGVLGQHAALASQAALQQLVASVLALPDSLLAATGGGAWVCCSMLGACRAAQQLRIDQLHRLLNLWAATGAPELAAMAADHLAACCGPQGQGLPDYALAVDADWLAWAVGADAGPEAMAAAGWALRSSPYCRHMLRARLQAQPALGQDLLARPLDSLPVLAALVEAHLLAGEDAGVLEPLVTTCWRTGQQWLQGGDVDEPTATALAALLGRMATGGLLSSEQEVALAADLQALVPARLSPPKPWGPAHTALASALGQRPGGSRLLVGCLWSLAQSYGQAHGDSVAVGALQAMLQQMLAAGPPTSYPPGLGPALTALVRQTLKRRLGCAAAIQTLHTTLQSLHPLFAPNAPAEGQLDGGSMLDMLLGHSQAPALLVPGLHAPPDENRAAAAEHWLASTQEAPQRLGLVRLLHGLVMACPKAAQEGHVVLLLGAYQASLYEADCLLLQVLQLYERQGLQVAPLAAQWGPASLTARLRPDAPIGAWAQAVLDGLDERRLCISVRAFAVHRPLEPRGAPCQGVADGQRQGYDPAFLLPVLALALDGGPLDARALVAGHVAAYAVRALSSLEPAVRHAASYLLHLLLTIHLPAGSFREQPQVEHVLGQLRNGLGEEGCQVPAVVTMFVCETLQIMLAPDHPLYKAINRFLLQRPLLPLDDVPLFYAFFNSGGEQGGTERVWMLRWLVYGLAGSTDWALYRRRHVLELLLSYHNSLLADRTGRTLVLQVLLQASQVADVARDMARHHGLAPWLLAVASQPEAPSAQHRDHVAPATYARPGALPSPRLAAVQIMANMLRHTNPPGPLATEARLLACRLLSHGAVGADVAGSLVDLLHGAAAALPPGPLARLLAVAPMDQSLLDLALRSTEQAAALAEGAEDTLGLLHVLGQLLAASCLWPAVQERALAAVAHALHGCAGVRQALAGGHSLRAQLLQLYRTALPAPCLQALNRCLLALGPTQASSWAPLCGALQSMPGHTGQISLALLLREWLEGRPEPQQCVGYLQACGEAEVAAHWGQA